MQKSPHRLPRKKRFGGIQLQLGDTNLTSQKESLRLPRADFMRNVRLDLLGLVGQEMNFKR